MPGKSFLIRLDPRENYPCNYKTNIYDLSVCMYMYMYVYGCGMRCVVYVYGVVCVCGMVCVCACVCGMCSTCVCMCLCTYLQVCTHAEHVEVSCGYQASPSIAFLIIFQTGCVTIPGTHQFDQTSWPVSRRDPHFHALPTSTVVRSLVLL